MHHVVVERWSRRGGPLHAIDARAKLGALLAFLIGVSTTPARPDRVWSLCGTAAGRDGGFGFASCGIASEGGACASLLRHLRRDQLVVRRAVTSVGPRRKEFSLGACGAVTDRHYPAHAHPGRIRNNRRTQNDHPGDPVSLPIPFRNLRAGATYAACRSIAAWLWIGAHAVVQSLFVQCLRGRAGRAFREIVGARRRDLSSHACTRILGTLRNRGTTSFPRGRPGFFGRCTRGMRGNTACGVTVTGRIPLLAPTRG